MEEAMSTEGGVSQQFYKIYISHLGWGVCVVLVLGVMGVPTVQYIRGGWQSEMITSATTVGF